jgi:hypothetical protein
MLGRVMGRLLFSAFVIVGVVPNSRSSETIIHSSEGRFRNTARRCSSATFTQLSSMYAFGLLSEQTCRGLT